MFIPFFQKNILYRTFWYQHFEYRMKTERTVIFSFILFNYENPFFLPFDIFIVWFGPLKSPKHFHIYLYIKVFVFLNISGSIFWKLNENWAHSDFLNDFSSQYPVIQRNVKISGKVSSWAHFKDNFILLGLNRKIVYI